ncbi:MAG: ATPase, T2SS/T4P/T4SS family, partial [Candidatus Parvarchaeota archaeon]
VNESMDIILKEIRAQLIREVPEKIQALSTELSQPLKAEFLQMVEEKLRKLLPAMSDQDYRSYAATLLHDMFGLGILEVIDTDPNLEEIVVNNSNTNVLVYHREYGWLRTNQRIATEGKIENYAQQIARKVGKQITLLNPLLDAQLANGDRINATLAPISQKGNTIDIRKFREEPWTLIDFLKNKTLTSELAAFIWQAMQYELSMIVSGGTASGKTSMLNVLIPFIPPAQRIITIEDTSELVLPKFMHWVPLLTRLPNAEGKGEVTMLDLLVNSLRMRPDRLVVGEIRRKEEAQTLFEALMTGHSVYATLHAETAQQVIKRLLSEPINLPDIEVSAMDIVLSMFRQRRLGIRRVLELAEIQETTVAGQTVLKVNDLFEWRARDDTIQRSVSQSLKIQSKLELYSGLSASEIAADIAEKKGIIEWMLRHNIPNIEKIGRISSLYYTDKDSLMKTVEKDGDPGEIEGY